MGEYAPGKSAGAPQGLQFETFSEDEGARNSSNPDYSGYSKDLRYTDTNSKACLQHAKRVALALLQGHPQSPVKLRQHGA